MVPAPLLPFMLVLATAATSSPRRPSSPARSRWRVRPCSSTCCRGCACCRPPREEQGQIYVPAVNILLFLAVVAFVLGFGSSDALSAAYGAAVIGTMAMTTRARRVRRADAVELAEAAGRSLLFGVLLFMDFTFLAGNLTKIDDGGWIPLALAACLFVVFCDLAQRAARQLRAALAELAVPHREGRHAARRRARACRARACFSPATRTSCLRR